RLPVTRITRRGGPSIGRGGDPSTGATTVQTPVSHCLPTSRGFASAICPSGFRPVQGGAGSASLEALIRPIFNQPDHARARDALSAVVAQLDGRLPKIAAMIEDAEDDILAVYAFPADHCRTMRSTNPLERFNREMSRR